MINRMNSRINKEEIFLVKKIKKNIDLLNSFGKNGHYCDRNLFLNNNSFKEKSYCDFSCETIMSDEFIKEIKKRRSIRSYDAKSVEKETIQKIIEAGRYAPSATNRQPWQFIVITNKTMIEDIANVIKNEIRKILKKRFFLKYFFPSLKNEKAVQFLASTVISEKDVLFFDAPVLIFVVTQKRKFNDESCACCAQNMMLAADALGLGSCWIGFAHFLGLNKEWMKKIGVPKGYHIAAALVLGHPHKRPSNILPRKPTANIINWIED